MVINDQDSFKVLPAFVCIKMKFETIVNLDVTFLLFQKSAIE